MAAQDAHGREVKVVVLQGHGDWVGDWEILCVELSDQPMVCHLCERPLVEMSDIGAWMLHAMSPLCTQCVEKHRKEKVPLNSLSEDRVNP